MLVYCIDVLKALKDAGYSQNFILKENIIPAGTLTKIRRSEPVSWKTLDTLCNLLRCQPGDIIEYVDE